MKDTKNIIWQDLVLGIGTWMFIIALIPATISDIIFPQFSSFVTAMVLSVFTFTVWTLNLRLTAICNLGIAIC